MKTTKTFNDGYPINHISSSAVAILIADRDLNIIWATCSEEHADVNNEAEKHAQKSLSFIGKKLSDVVELSNDDINDVCKTIIEGKKFHGCTKTYRKVIDNNDLLGKQKIIIVGPHLNKSGTTDGVVYAKFCANEDSKNIQCDSESAYLNKCLLENVSDIIFLLDQDGIVRFVNHRCKTYKGLSITNFIGKHFSEIVHPDDVLSFRKSLDHIFANGTPAAKISFRISTSNGAVLNIVANTCLIKSGGQTRLLGLCQDVTESLELQAKLYARNSALSALNKITVDLYNSESIDTALQKALEQVLKALSIERGYVLLSNEQGELSIGAYVGKKVPDSFIKKYQTIADNISSICTKQGKTLVIDDINNDKRFSNEYKNLMKSIGINSAVAVPLKSGQPIMAALILPVKSTSDLCLEQIEFVALAAGILGPAIENARLKINLQERAKQLTMLERLARSVNSDLDVQSMLNVCLQEISELIDFDGACVIISDSNNIADIYKYSIKNKTIKKKRSEVPVEAIEKFNTFDEPIRINGNKAIKDFHIWKKIGTDILSGACAQLKYKNMSGFGLLMIWSKTRQNYSDTELETLQAAANHLAIAVNNAKLYEAEKNKSFELKAMASEAQHRIKNNLQMIAGLLSINDSYSEQKSGVKATSRCLRQIKAIATVDELLASQNGTVLVEIASCIKKVADCAIVALGASERILVSVSSENINTTSNAATALGIIINELVSNAVEHGFADGRKGNINISIYRMNSLICVDVIDNGCGFPDHFEIPMATNCGLGLARSLVKFGLGGNLEIKTTDEGNCIHISF